MPGDGGLGDRAGPAAPDEQVGGRVEQLDALLVADDLVEQPVAAVPRRRRRGEEAVADHLAHGQAGVVGVAGGERRRPPR